MRARQLGILVFLLLLGLGASPAYAGPPEQDKAAFAFCLASITIIPLAILPVTIAFHLLFRALAPRATRQIVHATETSSAGTLVLGFLNTVVFLLVMIGAGERLPGLSLFALLAWWMLAGVGLHGVARSLGARILGSPLAESLGANRSELKELILGLFVIVYVGWFPFIGWFFGAYWNIRAVGSVIVAAFGGRAPEDELRSP